MSTRRSLLRVGMIPVRGWKSLHYPLGEWGKYLKWLFCSREHTNYTYDITPLNRIYMASALSVITSMPEKVFLDYMSEMESDQGLKEYLRAKVRNSDWGFLADETPRYGRRLAWYALVRAIHPKVIVETGVDKGLGACVLTAALLRNAEEGFAGRYYGTDINRKAGYFLAEPYSRVGEILYGDSVGSLSALEEEIDIFINDSDHSKDYEYQEYQVVKDKLSNSGILIGDNSHGSESLHRFSVENGRRFLFVKEEPMGHWYPGGGMGLSFPPWL